MTPLVTSTITRLEKSSEQITRTNHPTVNSLMHLYGIWILDCCLLQIKDRHSRSSINDSKQIKSYVNKITRMIDLIVIRQKETNKKLNRSNTFSFLVRLLWLSEQLVYALLCIIASV